MILNEALLKHEFVHRRFHEHVVRLSRKAKCFVFDKEASRLIGQFCDECDDVILQHRQFAKPPYEVTYIEYDSTAMAEGMGRQTENWDDKQIGFLVHGRLVYCVVGPNKDIGSKGFLWPVFYYYGERHSQVDYKSPFPILPYGDDLITEKLTLIIGRSMHVWYHKDDDDNRVRAKLQVMVEDLIYSNEAYFAGTAKLKPDKVDYLIHECSGDLKKVWAGLLWLQSVPKSVVYSPVPGGPSLLKGKRVVLSAHHTVHIHLKGKKTIKQQYLAATKHRNTPRHHEVRGHWKHRGGQAVGCGHIWPDNPNEDNHYICSKCERKRWWCKDFERGDKSKGFVEKDYVAEI